jgi:Tol biopolymer transport system component
MRNHPTLACLALLLLGCADTQAPEPDPRLQNVILFLSDRDGGRQMHLIAPAGGAIAPLYPDTNLPGSGVIYGRPAISPDGRWIAFTMLGDVWVARADGTDLRNLTQAPGEDVYPAWSPDGTRIAFGSDRDGDYEIYVVNVDGTALLQVTNDSGEDDGPAWTPDGARIGFSSDRGGDFDIYVVTLIGGSLVNLTENPGSDALPAWSSDGQTIAFTSSRDGFYGLYLMDADGGNTRSVVTDINLYAYFPSWGPGDSSLVFSGASVNFDIWTVRPDGSGLVNLTNDAAVDGEPVWAR